MSESKSGRSGGIGLLGAMFLVFLVLKLLGKITWSWLWVTAPLWGGLALVALILIGVGLFFLGAVVIDSIATWRRRRRTGRAA